MVASRHPRLEPCKACKGAAIEPKHTDLLTTMPFHHKDPFDRLLVAQALAEGIALVSVDVRLDAYGVTRLW